MASGNYLFSNFRNSFSWTKSSGQWKPVFKDIFNSSKWKPVFCLGEIALFHPGPIFCLRKLLLRVVESIFPTKEKRFFGLWKSFLFIFQYILLMKAVLPIKWKPILEGVFHSCLWKAIFCENNFLPYSKEFLPVKPVFPSRRNLTFKEIFITLSKNWFSGQWKPFLSIFDGIAHSC